VELFIIRVKFAIYYFLHFNTVRQVAARLRAKSAIYDCLAITVASGSLSIQMIFNDDLYLSKVNSKGAFTPPTPTPTRLNCRVKSRRRCVHNYNSQLVGDSLDESEQICQQRSRVASCQCTRRQS